MEFDGTTSHSFDRLITSFVSAWTEYSVASWIQSDVTNTDKGWFNLAEPDGSDSRGGVRYDAAGVNGGGTNLMKFGVVFTGGGGVQVESANNSQSTNLQFVVGRWKSGSPCEIFVDGVVSTPTAQDAGVVATLDGNLFNKVVLGRGPKENVGGSWDGHVYDHRVYNRWLTDEEIMTMFVLRGADANYDNISLWYRETGLAPGVSVPTTTDLLKDVTINELHLTANATGIVESDRPLKYQRRII